MEGGQLVHDDDDCPGLLMMDQLVHHELEAMAVRTSGTYSKRVEPGLHGWLLVAVPVRQPLRITESPQELEGVVDSRWLLVGFGGSPRLHERVHCGD